MDLEDILNGEDSDDDYMETKVLSVEQLLNEDSSDEEHEERPPLSSFTTAMPEVPSIYGAVSDTTTATSIPHAVQQLVEETDIQELGDLGLGDISLTAENLSRYLSELGVDTEEKEASDLPIYDTRHHSTIPVPLEQARQKEEGALTSPSSAISIKSVNGDVALSSPLKKKNKTLLSNYSNIKWAELTSISSQLKKNSSYKQHGPGGSSSMCIHHSNSSKFIAIGTTKGFILLFDNTPKFGSEAQHSNDIVHVLGSSLPAPASRCGSAVTAMEICTTYFSSFPVMVTGYATGELALWDIAKGTILKRVTDVHKSKIIAVQFLLNVDTGFAGMRGTYEECIGVYRGV